MNRLWTGTCRLGEYVHVSQLILTSLHHDQARFFREHRFHDDDSVDRVIIGQPEP